MQPINFKTGTTLVFAILISISALADVELSGVYRGKNVYVQNPFTSNMKDYCTKEVYVNDLKVMTEVHASAFEIDLSFVPVNDPVIIRITHKTNCNPKVLNPQVVKVESSFEFNSVNLLDNHFSFATKNENVKGRYFVERFEYSHWRILEEVYVDGSARYNLNLLHNSGSNKYRIKYLDEKGNAIYSEILDYDSGLEPVSFYPKRVSDNIYLSRKSHYQVLDKYGNEVSSGVKEELNLTGLSTDVYYLNVDNRTYKFFKK